MTSKIDIRPIVRSHFSTLRAFDSARVSKIDVGIFYILPAVPAGLFCFFGSTLNMGAFSNSVLAVFSVVLGLSLAFLALLFSQKEATKADLEVEEDVARIAHLDRVIRTISEVFYSTNYTILICAITMTAILASQLFDSGNARWFGAILTYFLSHFVLTFLMIIKRVHILFLD